MPVNPIDSARHKVGQSPQRSAPAGRTSGAVDGSTPPDQPVTTLSSGQASATSAHYQWTAKMLAMGITAPTAVCQALPPHCRFVQPAAIGASLWYLLHQPEPTEMVPGRTEKQRIISTAIQGTFFPPAYYAQAALTERSADPKSLLFKVAQGTEAGFKLACDQLPTALAQAARKFPMTYFLARASAHAGGGGAGMLAADAYLHLATGGERRHVAEGHVEPASTNFAALVLGFGLFKIPTVMATPESVAVLRQAFGLAKTPMILGGAVALASAILKTAQPRPNGESMEAQSDETPQDQLK